jgi:hypothetical protein
MGDWTREAALAATFDDLNEAFSKFRELGLEKCGICFEVLVWAI